MAKHHAKRRSEKAGMTPGAAVAVGKTEDHSPTKISVFTYHAEGCSEVHDVSPDALPIPSASNGTTWINVNGIHDPDLVQKIGQRFGLHPLCIEDILNSEIRPKQEDHADYIAVILKMLVKGPNRGKSASCFCAEQIAIVLGKNWVLTFQEHHAADVFDPLRQRIRTGAGKIRTSGADYLAYALIDAVVDGYFVVLEDLGEEIEELESEVTRPDAAPMLTKIHFTRNFGLYLRRYVWPVRDVLAGIERNGSPLISANTRMYLRDVYDHAIEIMEMLEAYREMVAGLMELHLSANSNRMNSVMMVLTTVTTIFMPLTFIAGVYGMNFEFMPELHWQYGYPLVLGVMGLVAFVMLAFFRRRRWI